MNNSNILYNLQNDINNFLNGVNINDIYNNINNNINNNNTSNNDDINDDDDVDDNMNLNNNNKKRKLSLTSNTIKMNNLKYDRLLSQLKEEKILRERDKQIYKIKIEEIESERDKYKRQVNFLLKEEETLRNEFKEKNDLLNNENLKLKDKLNDVLIKLSTIENEYDLNENNLNNITLNNKKIIYDMEKEINKLNIKLKEKEKHIELLKNDIILEKSKRESIEKSQLNELKKLKELLKNKDDNGDNNNNNNNNYKILHFKMNPYQIAIKEKEENENLLNASKVSLNDSTINNMNNFSGLTSTPNRSQSLNNIATDKLNQRLKEIFRQRIDFFRECVYLLSGYRIDVNQNHEYPQVRLRSMYAESERDYIQFQWRDDKLELVQTSFIQSLDQSLFQILNSSNSIPAFLSHITLDLFEKQTYQL